MTKENDSRANPDSLLRTIKNSEEARSKGKLRIFFGMCPGVGKTYAMLKSARSIKDLGQNVLVGLVETHGRVETEELLKGMEVLPRKIIHYREKDLLEFDIDETLKRRPDLVLVDELAHTNAPGSRHNKRWQDVEELINNGISVFTTLNVQHVESRTDLVYQITSIPVRESVPDRIFEIANQVELIDITPEELLRRLREGKVYIGDRAQAAEGGFFKENHLIALRELSLRLVAEKVDHELQDKLVLSRYREAWNTGEKLLVAISQSPYSARLIRATRRMAFNLEAQWFALNVDNGERLSEDDYNTLQKNILLARDLGAEIIHTRDINISNAIQRIAHEKNVTQIVIGRPDRRFFRDLLSGGTLLDQLVRDTSLIDIHVIRQERLPRFKGFKLPEFRGKSPVAQYFYTFVFLTITTVIGFTLQRWFDYKSIGYIYLLSVLIVSAMYGKGPIFFSAALSALAWNFFFMPPTLSFEIGHAQDMLMVYAYFLVASLGGILNARIRKHEKLLILREERANLLYELTRNLSEATSVKDILTAGETHLKPVFKNEINLWIADKNGNLSIVDGINRVPDENEKDYAVARWSFENRKMAGWSTDTLSGARTLCFPLLGKTNCTGVVLFYPKQERQLSLEQSIFIETAVKQLAIALEREILNESAKEVALLKESERLYQTLVNSISHEIRTPLTAIMGNAAALQHENILSDKEFVRSSSKELGRATERLNQVVENLLDMSRIESGHLIVKSEVFSAIDLIEHTLRRLETHLAKHKVKISNEVLGSFGDLISGDFKLLDHAIGNLLLNAAHYSPIESEIRIGIRSNEHSVILQISDQGPGIRKEYKERVFEKFFRVPGTPTGGVGLGLSIVKGILDAHSAMIKLLDVTIGTTFEIRFPKADLPDNIKGELT